MAIIALEFEIKIGLLIKFGYSNIASIKLLLESDLFLYNSFQIFSCVLIKSIGLRLVFDTISLISSLFNLLEIYKTNSN